jgi:hypothetical protein
MHVALQVGHALFQIAPLAPDALELLALRADPRVSRLRGERRRQRDHDDEREEQRPPAYTLRRCLPTATALPTSPINAPNSNPRAAVRSSKKTVSMM